MTIKFNTVLDVRHKDSPIPTILTKEALDALPSGDVLKVIISVPSNNPMLCPIAQHRHTDGGRGIQSL